MSFSTLTFSVVLVATLVNFSFGKTIEYGAELSAMAIGLYTGGTPNLNAIGNIFGVEGSLIARANLSDMIIGAVFYLFLLTICKPLLRKVLKPAGDAVYLTKKSEIVNKEELNLKELRHYKSLIFTTVLAVLMVTGGALLRVVVWITGGRPEGNWLILWCRR
ncbi:MAG: DUF819 family protein [Bacilli bacterium]|nr:DUF819 family protein [Bacilli bacterium]